MKKALAAGTALLVLFAAPAFAGEGDVARQIQALQEQLKVMQQQLEQLKASDAANKAALAKETAAREAAEKEARDANVAAGGTTRFQAGRAVNIPPQNPKVVESATHRFTLSSADNAWSIAPTGRIHMDMGIYLNQKPEAATGVGTVTGGKLSSGVNVRRGRFGVTGRAMNDFTYTFILDAGGASDNTTLINTAQIAYTGIANTIIEAGYSSHFFTLDESTSSNDIMFLERASPATVASGLIAGDPRFGAGFRRWGTNWWIGAYLMGSRPGEAHGLTQRTFGAFQRATYQLIQEDLRSIHVGVGVGEVFEAADTGPNTAPSVTLSERPELRIDPTNLLNTGALGTLANPVTGAMIYNLETAAHLGRLFYQGEYFRYDVSRRGRTKAKTQGAYAQVSYTIGGMRSYVANSGAYSGVNPDQPLSFKNLAGSGMGAFEFAARVSYTDLVDQYDSSLPAAAQPFLVNGGTQLNTTLALNWFWNSNMLWKLNYIHTNFKRATPSAAGIGVPVGIDLDSIALRWQAMF